MTWQQDLRRRTNDPVFLWRMVGVVLASGAAIAWVFQGVPAYVKALAEYREQIPVLIQAGEDAGAVWLALLDDDKKFEEVLETIALMHRARAEANSVEQPLHRRLIDLAPYQKLLDEAELPAGRLEIAQAMWASCAAEAIDPKLSELAARDPPQRFANHAIAVYWESNKDFGRAIKAYQLEGQLPDAKLARESLVDILVKARDFDRLRKLSQDPAYRDVISLGIQIHLRAEERDWWSVFWLIPRWEIQGVQWGPASLAWFSGFWWFVFALHAGQSGTQRGARWWLCVLAVPLGVLSIWVTVFLIHWQRATWDIREASDLVGGLRYFVVGVGLREEFSKLLLLTPLMPFLARRGNTLETLIVGACVGLGFAIFENQRYFAGSAGTAAVERFATANFFHMAATALLGLATVRAIRSPAQRAPEAIAWFLLIVLAHGLYDAFLDLPALAEYSIVWAVIFVLLAYQFFHELRYARSDRMETVSLTATFLFSVSIVAAAALVYTSTQLGFFDALGRLVPSLISIAVMVYVFLREMPNSLVTV